jgi:hypothetical protein
MIGKAAIFLKHLKDSAYKAGKWATSKPTNKIRTGDPMIKRDLYNKDSKLKFKRRREILKNKESFSIMAARKFKKATPLGKAGYASLAVAPKAAFVGVGYLASGDKKE